MVIFNWRGEKSTEDATKQRKAQENGRKGIIGGLSEMPLPLLVPSSCFNDARCSFSSSLGIYHIRDRDTFIKTNKRETHNGNH